MEDCIRIPRGLFDLSAMENAMTMKIFLWCVTQASPWDKQDVPRGSFLTSRSQGMVSCGATEREWKTAMESLSSSFLIEVKTSNKNTAISVCDYGTYVFDNVENVQQTPSKRPANAQQDSEPKKPRRKPDMNQTENFEQWWQVYPKKVAVAAAAKAFQAALRDMGSDKVAAFGVLMNAVTEFRKATEENKDLPIPHPATWLNGKRWLDDRSEWYRGKTGRKVASHTTPLFGMED